MTFVRTAALSVLALTVTSVAQAETPRSHAYRLCMADYATRVTPTSSNPTFWGLARKVCTNFAKNPNPNQLADFEAAYGTGGGSSAGEAAAAFLGGVVEGFADSYNPGGGSRGYSSRTHTVYSPHANYRSGSVSPTAHTSVATASTSYPVRPSQTVRTRSPIANRTASTTSSTSGTITAIRQPNGRLDPVYKKPPCLTTAQTGPTSYKCTNN